MKSLWYCRYLSSYGIQKLTLCSNAQRDNDMCGFIRFRLGMRQVEQPLNNKQKKVVEIHSFISKQWVLYNSLNATECYLYNISCFVLNFTNHSIDKHKHNTHFGVKLLRIEQQLAMQLGHYTFRRLIFPHLSWLDSHLFAGPVAVSLRRYS